MTSADDLVSSDDIADALGSVRSKGVRIWAENGQLRYRGPKNALTQDEIEWLRASKNQIVAFLEEAAGGATAELGRARQARVEQFPLTHSQRARWHSYQSQERRSIRQIASATRLLGRLNLDAFRNSVIEIIRRHEALRTRIVVRDDGPVQEVASFEECELEVRDLTAVPRSGREDELRQLIEEFILRPVDLATGPLFGLQLVKLGDSEHVVILAMEHIISDMSSLRILLRDLFEAYVQAVRLQHFSLPEIGMQFPDYAVWQNKAHASWIQRHGEYWNECVTRFGRTRFPDDEPRPEQSPRGWGAVAIHIDKELKRELLTWCRLRQTTLVMSVFTAYVGLVLQWCRASEALLQYAIDGRVHEETKHTVGYFASVLYVRAQLLATDDFIDLLNRVTAEYCRAYEHMDSSYLMAQVPRPEFTQNSAFNWIPQVSQAQCVDLDQAANSLLCAPVTFDHPAIRNLSADNEPSVLLFDTEEEVVGSFYFPRERFSVATMERFSRGLRVFLETLVRRPETLVTTTAF